MPGIIEGVEPNQIAVEQRFEDLIADGERTIELRRRERAVQEEADAEAVESAAQERREGEEVVIVDPDVVVLGVEDLDDALGEELVGEDVGLPVGAVEAAAVVGGVGEHVVDERPERLLAEAVVEAVAEVLGEEGRDAAEAVEERLRDVVLVGGGDVGVEGADVEDLHVHVVGEAVAEVEEERVLVPGEAPAAPVGAALPAHGERVGDDDEAVAGERGLRVGGDAARAVLVEVRERPGRRAGPLHPPGPRRTAPAARSPSAAAVVEGGEVAVGEIEQVGVGSREHGGRSDGFQRPRFRLDRIAQIDSDFRGREGEPRKLGSASAV